MLEEIKNILKEPLKNEGLFIDSITYQNKNLNIILDSDNIIDLDRIVSATKVINKILDEKDFIKEEYLLDVSSKEKGEVK